MSQPSAWCPPGPASPPVTDLEPRGGGGRGSGIQRPAPRWGQEVTKGEGTTTEGLGVADLPYSISQPGLGSGEGGRGYFLGCRPPPCPWRKFGWEWSGAGGRYFYFRAALQRGVARELSVTAAAGREDPWRLPKLTPSQGSRPWEPRATAAPGRDRLLSRGGLGSHF